MFEAGSKETGLDRNLGSCLIPSKSTAPDLVSTLALSTPKITRCSTFKAHLRWLKNTEAHQSQNSVRCRHILAGPAGSYWHHFIFLSYPSLELLNNLPQYFSCCKEFHTSAFLKLSICFGGIVTPPSLLYFPHMPLKSISFSISFNFFSRFTLNLYLIGTTT